MLNGTTAKVTNYAVAFLAVLAVVGVIGLGMLGYDIPNELSMVLTASIGYLVGTNVVPIGAQTKEVQDLQPNDKVVAEIPKDESK